MADPQFPCQHGVPFGGAIPNCAKCTNAILNQGRPMFDRMVAMLRKLEWASDGPDVHGYGGSRCPSCGASGNWGYDAGESFVKKEKHRPKHTPDCALATLLAELP